MKIKNSSGKIYYGMHFYPGLAQYSEPGKEPFRIFLNEDTLRKMDASFAGKPIFVEHVDEVHSDLNELRKEADGWVTESFFNSVDGKHWVKMVIVSDRGDRAIKNGFRLSNAYVPQLNGKPGEWNGITYQNEVVDGIYEHLAIVDNPRYDESIIMTPDEFKQYNENLQNELKRIANSKKETRFMKLKFWNRKAVESTVDFENTFVSLPKTNKEYSILQLVNAMDEMEEKKKENNADHSAMVKLHDGTMCNVGELVEKYKSMCEKKEGMENEEVETESLDLDDSSVDVEGNYENEDDAEAEGTEDKKDKMKNVKSNKENKNNYFDSIKNAPNNTRNSKMDLRVIETPQDQVARGKARYG